MKKNDIIELEIQDITTEGSGVGKYDGMAIFVPMTAVGDIINARILKVKKNYAFAKVENIIKPSANRCENKCYVYNKCGGCVLRHINYESETQLKENRVYQTIKRIGGIDIKPQPIIASVRPDRYRNKAQLPINTDGKIGFYALNTHRIVNTKSCLLQPVIFDDIINVTEKWIEKYKISIYDETCHKGLLRHLYMRIGEVTGEIMVCLVINGSSLPYSNELLIELKDLLKENLKSLQININKENTNVILGKKCKLIYGDEYINDVLCGIKIRLSPLSFFQVNHDMAEKLYNKAIEYANPSDKVVLDLYCGAGTIGLSMANKAKKIIGVEIVENAVNDAKYNAEINNITNAEFICADAKEAADKLYKDNIKPDVIIIDPPRKGCSSELIEIISNGFKPEKVVYVSCDVATLARDIKIFSEKGYELLEYTPVDLFPRTVHVETVVLMSRLKQ